MRLKVRSLVGLLPLCASTVFEPEVARALPALRRAGAPLPRVAPRAFREHRLADEARRRRPPPPRRRQRGEAPPDPRADARRGASSSPPTASGRSSRCHREHPYVFALDRGRQVYSVEYEPAESTSGMFGGNSNWRGPVWFPMNTLLIRALLHFYTYYGDDFQVECPDGLGPEGDALRGRAGDRGPDGRDLPAGPDGRRPVYGGTERFQKDPHWRDYLLFYEYFHGDNGAGLGASHQTGWTGLVAKSIQMFGALTPEARARRRDARGGDGLQALGAGRPGRGDAAPVLRRDVEAVGVPERLAPRASASTGSAAPRAREGRRPPARCGRSRRPASGSVISPTAAVGIPALAPDRLGERDLVAGADGDLRVGDEAARAAVDEVGALVLQAAGERDALVERPASLGPVGARQPHRDAAGPPATPSGRPGAPRGRSGSGSRSRRRTRRSRGSRAARGSCGRGSRGRREARPSRSRPRARGAPRRGRRRARPRCRLVVISAGPGPSARTGSRSAPTWATRRRRRRGSRFPPTARPWHAFRPACASWMPGTAPCVSRKRAIRASGVDVRVLPDPEVRGRDPPARLDRGGLGHHEPGAADGARSRGGRGASRWRSRRRELYWHIGETPIRLRSVSQRSVSGSKRCCMNVERTSSRTSYPSRRLSRRVGLLIC